MVICFVFSWLTLNRIEFAMKDMRRLSRAGSLASRRTESDPRLYKLRPWIVWPGVTLILTPHAHTAIGRSEPYGSNSRSRDGSSGQKARASNITLGQRQLWESAQIYTRLSEEFTLSPPPRLTG